MSKCEYIIKTNNLTKYFGNLKAVDNLTFNVKESEIFGLLGPNGAGKTTTIRLLIGMLVSSEGQGEVVGYDIKTQSDFIREKVGVLTETSSLYERLSVRDNLKLYAKIHSMPKSEINGRINDIVDLFDIKEKLDSAAGTLSKGMKQKVAIARAIIHDPILLFLDEPTSALAPESAKIVRDLIVNLTKEKHRTVFINTHNLAEAEKLCTRVAIIENGKLIAIGSPSELRALLKSETITVFRFKKWEEYVVDYFSNLDKQLLEFNKSDLSLSVKLRDIEEQIPEIIKDLVSKDVSIVEVTHTKPSLERIYLELVNGENKDKRRIESK